MIRIRALSASRTHSINPGPFHFRNVLDDDVVVVLCQDVRTSLVLFDILSPNSRHNPRVIVLALYCQCDGVVTSSLSLFSRFFVVDHFECVQVVIG